MKWEGTKKYASKSHRPGTGKTFPFSTMLVCEENFFFSLLHRRSAYYNNRQTKLERGNYKNEMQIPFSAKLFPRSFSREFLQVLPMAITKLWHDCLDGVGRVEEKERERVISPQNYGYYHYVQHNYCAMVVVERWQRSSKLKT